MDFDLWLSRQNHGLRSTCLGLYRDKQGKVFAFVDGEGWFAPQWIQVPPEVRVGVDHFEAYG